MRRSFPSSAASIPATWSRNLAGRIFPSLPCSRWRRFPSPPSGTCECWSRLRGRPPQGPQLLQEFFEKLGGSFIKFGQILSLQIDSLPREYCDALLSLLDRVPPFPPEQVERAFMESLHASPRDLYQGF